MKKIAPALLLLSLVFAGCSKDDNPAPPVANYQPATANSTWTYNVHNNVNAANSYNFTIKSTGADTTAGGKTYKIYTNTSASNEYYTHTGANYYQYGGFEGLTNAIELNYLKTDAAVNSTWEEIKSVTISGFPVTATFKYTLTEKLDSYVVNTVTFKNVMHVKVELTVPGLTINSQDLHFYYADGVGRIKSQIKLVATFIGVNIDTETTLTNYTIVP